MNATLQKFGYPASLIREYRHWCVLLRPAQATLASLVLASTGEATAFSALAPAAYAELDVATKGIERILQAFRPYDRINYLMLMMVDPHVHFHVVPRYREAQTFAGISFADPGWPGLPDLKSATEIDDQRRAQLLQSLRQLADGT